MYNTLKGRPVQVAFHLVSLKLDTCELQSYDMMNLLAEPDISRERATSVYSHIPAHGDP